MALVPFEPFRHLDHWRRDIDRFFNEGFPWTFSFNRDFNPLRVDVYETENEVVASCEIPGLEKKEDIHLHVDDQTLVIHGSINRMTEVKDEQMHRRERFTGRFQRSIPLPARVEAEGTTASYKNGILEVRMPKAKGDTRRPIDIQFH